MECLNKNCNVAGNERMVSCWLCLGCCHLKCSGLKARDADALADPAKSLQWSCSNCKVIKVEFYKFFKSYKNEFDQLNNEFLELHNKFSKFGELFTNFAKLDNFVSGQNVSSPKSKKTPNKSPTLTPLITFSSTTTPMNSVEIDKTPEVSNSISPMPLTTHTTSSYTASYSNVTSVGVNNDTHTTIHSIRNLPSNNNQMCGEPRISVPRKTIFATRFHCDTTVEHVNNFISSKFNNTLPERINVYKINSRNRTSFKIIVPLEYFEQIVDPKFWPKYTIVREFIYREEKLAHIPVCGSSVPKN